MAQQVYSLNINSNVAGQFASNIIHWRFDDAGFTDTVTAAFALINAWQTAALTAFRACIPTDVTVLSLKSRRVSANGGFEAVSLPTGSVVGTRSGTTSVSGISPCIILFGLGNVRTRGRIFLPGLSESDCDNGIFTEAYKTAIKTQSNTFLDDVTLTGGGAPVATNVIFKRSTKTSVDVYEHQLSDTVGTIRRRQLPA